MSGSLFDPLTFRQVWVLVHGRDPTDEELERSRARALMVLDRLKLEVSDSDDIWTELG
jgi:hypothetical protein